MWLTSSTMRRAPTVTQARRLAHKKRRKTKKKKENPPLPSLQQEERKKNSKRERALTWKNTLTTLLQGKVSSNATWTLNTEWTRMNARGTKKERETELGELPAKPVPQDENYTAVVRREFWKEEPKEKKRRKRLIRMKVFSTQQCRVFASPINRPACKYGSPLPIE